MPKKKLSVKLSYDNIPDELRERDQWLCWLPKKFDKCPRDLQRVKTDKTDTDKHLAFDDIDKKKFGAGFCLTPDDPFVVIDLDNCVENYVVNAWAQKIVDRLDSYTEISPSGTGIRIVGLTDKKERTWPGDNCTISSLEGFFTMTGCCIHPVNMKSISYMRLRRLFRDRIKFRKRKLKPQKLEYIDHGLPEDEVIKQAKRYIDNCAQSVGGTGDGRGDKQMMKIVSILLFDFGLSREAAMPIALDFGSRANPPWEDEKQISHKFRFLLSNPTYGPEDDKKCGWRVKGGVLDDEELDDMFDSPERVDDEAMPAECLSVGGFIGQFMDYMAETCIVKQPTLFLPAAIAAQGVLAGNKVVDEWGNRTGLYFLSLAPAGRGKEHPQNCIRKLFGSLDNWEPINFQPRSETGMYRAFEKQPTRLWLWDEIGRSLDQVRHDRGGHGAGVLTGVVKMFGSQHAGASFADSKNSIHVHNACLSVLASTVPDNYFRSLSETSLVDGYASRFLVFEADPKPDDGPGLQKDVPGWLKTRAAAWLAWMDDERTLIDTEATKRRFKAIRTEIRKELYDEPSVSRQAVLARMGQMTRMLALCHSVSENPDADMIDADSLDWAYKLVRYCGNTVCRAIDTWMSDGKFNDMQLQVLRWVANPGKYRLTKAGYNDRFWRWEDKVRDAVFDSLKGTKLRVTKKGKAICISLK